MKSVFIGSLLWVSSIQYFIIQIIVAAAYASDFSLATNTISDLGNTVCGPYGDRYVCSPLNLLMNVSFIVLGFTQLLGSVLLFYVTAKSKQSFLGIGSMVLAGTGTLMVGAFPENTVGYMHAAGAALPFVFGNVSMLLLGNQLKLPGWLKYYSYLSGTVGLSALVLFVTQTYVGIGHGGLERVVAYPQTVWMIVVGVYFLHSKGVRLKENSA